MAIIKLTKDGVSNEIVADFKWAKATYPDHTVEDITVYPTSDEILEEEKAEARQWRNDELERTDSLSLLSDHPQKTQITTYRTALREWPSTSDFPDTPPTEETAAKCIERWEADERS